VTDIIVVERLMDIEIMSHCSHLAICLLLNLIRRIQNDISHL